MGITFFNNNHNLQIILQHKPHQRNELLRVNGDGDLCIIQDEPTKWYLPSKTTKWFASHPFTRGNYQAKKLVKATISQLCADMGTQNPEEFLNNSSINVLKKLVKQVIRISIELGVRRTNLVKQITNAVSDSLQPKIQAINTSSENIKIQEIHFINNVLFNSNLDPTIRLDNLKNSSSKLFYKM